MATYKVIQNIEAEDHILGPLSLHQFLYALATMFFLYLCFIAVTKNILFLLIFFAPPAMLTGFFAYPFARDQPTEVWALAKLRFIIKPRKRIWNQSGIKELVTITAPKHAETRLTNGLTKNEVNDRLQALATTIDSRGWVIKNVSTAPPDVFYDNSSSERLLDVSSIPRPVPDYQIAPAEDMLDDQNNPIAIHMQDMILKSDSLHRQKIIDSLNSAQAQQPNQEWFKNESEEVINQRLKTNNTNAHLSTSNLHTLNINPHDKTQQASITPETAKINSQSLHQSRQPIIEDSSEKKTTTVDADILNFAGNNDLDVATIQRQVNKPKDDEVVINLH